MNFCGKQIFKGGAKKTSKTEVAAGKEVQEVPPISKGVTSHVMPGKVLFSPHNNVALFCVKQVCVLKACLHMLYLAEPGWLARHSPEQ